VVVHRGDRSRFRLWRALFELRHPGPSKRQGHAHTVGRKNRGTIRVPPGTLCEAAATGIPGERVQVGAIEGWGAALPMVDDYLDTLDQGEILVVSAEGITAIDAPRGAWARLKARFLLIVAFDRIDASRSAALAEQGERAHTYVRELEHLGFRTSFEGRRTPGTVALPVVLDPLTYLVTLGANSLSHMAIVLAMLLCVLYGRVAYALRTARRNRASIPLVVGGWGTRGKSGTERIKAGLFSLHGVDLSHSDGGRNNFAAVPSFHFGFPLLATIGFCHAFRLKPWQCALAGVVPAVMLLAIVSTANHFFLDAVIGACVVLFSAWWCVWRTAGSATPARPRASLALR
jgi:hypothetical protein